MKIIVGLGNPGKKYAYTRHNAGFMALDKIIEALKPENARWEKKFDAEILEIHNSPFPPLNLRGGERVIFVKPQTFMNESGKAVRAVCDFYKIDVAKDLLIIHDDTDLPLGTIRTTDSSSAAGHNGVQNIINALGRHAFHRIRIGVETRASRDDLATESFVLQPFTDEELKKLREEVLPQVQAETAKFLKT